MKTYKSFTLYRLKMLVAALVVLFAFSRTFAQVPPNDLCSTPTVLTSATTCNVVPGTLENALVSAPAVTGCGTPGADVWYQFVAQSAYPTITLSSMGTSLTGNARIQLFSGVCGSLTSLGCVTAAFFNTAVSYTAGLIPGNTYYIRIYSANTTPIGAGLWQFSICVTDPPVNDLCSNAISLTSSITCNTTAGTLNNAAVSVPAITTTCGTAGADVWYSFVAQTAWPTITLSSTGASLGTANARIQLFSGACGSLTSLGCASGNLLSSATVYPAGLTPGVTYYLRIYSNTAAPAGAGVWDFSICVTDPPANDLCSNAVSLTSSVTCNPVAGTLSNAAVSNPAVTTTCTTAGGDVWYSFVAQAAFPTITMSAMGTSLTSTSARIQIFFGSCGALTSLGCVSTNVLNTVSVNPTGLTPGNTYFVRIYSSTLAPTGSTWNFSICVTDPPANDLCSTAVTLTSSAICNTVAGTLNNAAVSFPAIATTCGTAGGDVWYSFVAQSAFPTITMSSMGASLTSSTARIQLFSGSCAALTSLGCVSTNVFNTAAAYPTGLIPGNTYFFRVYSNTTVPTGGAAWDFAICVTDPPANDLCGNAVTITSGIACTNTAGTVNSANLTTGTAAACTGTAKYDVWYSFVAQSANPSITLSNIEANFLAQGPRLQVYSGGCGALANVGCSTGPALTSPLGLTVGNTYLVRVYSITTSPAPLTLGNFDICIQDPVPPVNDDCTGAILLTSSLTCNNITTTVINATPSAGMPAACSGTVKYDVWYTFVAQTTNPAIKISNAGTTFTAQLPKIQVFSGTCGSLTSVGCGNSTYTPTGLTVGATYYVRVYSITTSGVPGTLGDFDICIQDPPAPLNDNCAGAVALTSGTGCTNTAGTLLNATPTTGIPNDCGNPASPEVWYSFVANSAYPFITLSSLGAQFSAAGPRVQILTGSCGSFTSIGCTSSTTVNTYLLTGGPGLTIGNTYYIRIYTASASMAGAAWGFNICITDPSSPVVDYGKSYFNITKGSGGGTIEPGDELEIRATVTVRSNWAFNASFTGAIPANTSYKPGTMRLLTNEGQVYKQWTDAADGDPATISGSTVTINFGNGATQTMGGTVNSTDRPLAGGRYMVIVSYHVIVDAVSFGSLVSVGGGTISYANGAGAISNINFPAVTAVVYRNYGICANTIGSNGILSESGGTFGSGNLKDRAPSGNVPVNYTYAPFTTGNPGDYLYGMSNNTSAGTGAANYSVNPADPVAAHKVFGVWDIIGDHTGAADPLAGNLPADVNNGQNGGYMVVINASYRTDTAFLDTVRNLCPNTSYEYSAWFRNVCRKCGIDSTGTSSSSGAYVPTGPGDTSGVHPNLTFNINGYDYYTTGDMGYTGFWVKKGFTYRTGPSETQMIISIRNNAPGGGGNDWAIDDIGVASCSPSLDLNPSTTQLNVCYADGASLSASVRSYFDNYTYYVWERSTDSGVTFTSTPYFSSGTISPVYNGAEYEYSATGPSFIGDSTTHNNIFRLRVASSAGNLADPNCSYLATRVIKVYVNNCMWLLKLNFLEMTGSLKQDHAVIHWTTANETSKTSYEIEKSTDGVHFVRIAIVNANGQNGNGIYTFNDPAASGNIAYYRIKATGEAVYTYSKTILLNTSRINFSVQNLVNPFTSTISCNVILPEEGVVRATVLDIYGRPITTSKRTFVKGVNSLKITDPARLSAGTYILRIEWQNSVIIKKIIRTK